MKWYRIFNHDNNQQFVNPYTVNNSQKLPIFLDNNPDIKEAIVSYCNSNLLELSSLTLQDYIINTCLPQLLEKRKKELNNQHLDLDFIKRENNLNTLCRNTVTRWMNILGFNTVSGKRVTTVTAMRNLRMLCTGINILIDI